MMEAGCKDLNCLSNYLITGHCRGCDKTRLHQCMWGLSWRSSSWQSCDLQSPAVVGLLLYFASCLAGTRQTDSKAVTSFTVFGCSSKLTLALCLLHLNPKRNETASTTKKRRGRSNLTLYIQIYLRRMKRSILSGACCLTWATCSQA